MLINVERYWHTSAEPPDLIQAAAAGLFGPSTASTGVTEALRTYAVHWLNEGFRSFLYNATNTIRVPVYLQKSMKHVNAAIQRLGNPNVSLGELAHETGIRRPDRAGADGGDPLARRPGGGPRNECRPTI